MSTHTHGMIENARRAGPKPRSRAPDRAAAPQPAKGVHIAHGQTGSMLLEAFIAILIFSMGILAIVGMQASAVKSSTDAKYRSEASLLANELIGRMWVSDRTPATLQANFQGGAGADGAAYTTWYATVQATLPGAGANPPIVSVNTATSLVTVTILWKAPSDPPAEPAHRFSIITQIL